MLNCNGRFILAAVIVIFFNLTAFAQIASNRFALILEDPPVSAKATSREEMLNSAASRNYRQQIAARQQSIRAELASRKIQVTSATETLLNPPSSPSSARNASN